MEYVSIGEAARRLGVHPEAWQVEQEERQEWEATLADGLGE